MAAMYLGRDFGPEHDRTLYHYTTTAGLIGIAKTGSLWATNILHLNDAKEYRHTLDLIRERIEQRELTPDERLFLDALTFSITSDIHGDSIPTAGMSTYVISFSEKLDQLSQWRAYGGSGSGFVVGVAPSYLRERGAVSGFRLVHCVYTRSDQHQRIDQLLGKYLEVFKADRKAFPPNALEVDCGKHPASIPRLQELRKDFLSDTQQLAPELKHRSFEEEAEWRLVSDPQFNGPKPQLNFRESAIGLTPYQVVPMMNDDGQFELRLIVVGPSQHRGLNFWATVMLANRQDHPIFCPSINTSETPWRN